MASIRHAGSRYRLVCFEAACSARIAWDTCLMSGRAPARLPRGALAFMEGPCPLRPGRAKEERHFPGLPSWSRGGAPFDFLGKGTAWSRRTQLADGERGTVWDEREREVEAQRRVVGSSSDRGFQAASCAWQFLRHLEVDATHHAEHLGVEGPIELQASNELLQGVGATARRFASPPEAWPVHRQRPDCRPAARAPSHTSGWQRPGHRGARWPALSRAAAQRLRGRERALPRRRPSRRRPDRARDTGRTHHGRERPSRDQPQPRRAVLSARGLSASR